MSRALINYEDFKRSWMRITAKGRHASLDAIYDDIGRKGSKSTLQKYRTSLLEELSNKGAEILPATIPHDMVPLIEEFFTKSVSIAGNVYEAHRKDMEQSIERTNAKNAELSAELDELKRIRKGQDEFIESLQATIEDQKSEMHDKTVEEIKSAREKASLEERIDRMAELHQAESQAQRQDYNAKEKDWITKLDALSAQGKEEAEKARLAVAQADKNADHFLLQIRDERDKSNRMEENLKATITRLESQLTISQKREDGMGVKLGKIEERLLKLQEKYELQKDHTSQTIQNLKAEVSDCWSEFKWLRRDNEKLEEENKALVAKLESWDKNDLQKE